VHADGGDLALAHPNARKLRDAARLDAEIRQRVDQGLFDGPYVRAHIALPLAQVQDGVADDLSRPVVGHVAAPVRGMEGDTGAAQDLFASQKVLHVAVAAQGDGVGVLQQDKLVGDSASLAPGHQALLPFEGAGVLHAARFPPLALKH